jgi:hypothetical protein
MNPEYGTLVAIYKVHFGPEDGGDTLLRNVAKYLQDYTAS